MPLKTTDAAAHMHNDNRNPLSPELRRILLPLHRLNNWRGACAIVEDYAVIAAAVMLGIWNVYLYPLAVLIIGSRQRALASLLHESCHLTLAQNRGLNLFIGRYLAGFPIFQSHDTYRQSHVLCHHVFLGNARRDPDYVNCIETGLYDVSSSKEFVRRHLLKTALLGNVPRYLKYLIINRLGSLGRNHAETLGLLGSQAVLCLLLSLVAGPWGYLLFWLIPYLTSFQIIGWLSEVAEHFRLYERTYSRIAMTRNRFPSWWERIFIGMHGDNYHLTHHMCPGIPFWNLRRAHGILLQDPEYATSNQYRGGIISAPAGRMSVLQEIIEDIDRSANQQSKRRSKA